MEGFKIPRLESIAERVTSRAKGKQNKLSILRSTEKATIEQCQHCGYLHHLTSYCSRDPEMGRKRAKRTRIMSSSSSSSSSEEDRELSSSPRRSDTKSLSDSEADNTEAKEGASAEEDKGDSLEGFFSAQKRVDAKEPKLKLLPSSVKYYFSTVLKNGELTKEGKEEMQEKYYLDPGED